MEIQNRVIQPRFVNFVAAMILHERDNYDIDAMNAIYMKQKDAIQTIQEGRICRK